MPHKTRIRSIKELPIDEGIYPVVKWLNSFRGIYTLHSCQGNYKDGLPVNESCAYIIFNCDEPINLTALCDFLYNLAIIEVETYNGSLRYRLYFDQKGKLDRVIDAIKRKVWNPPRR